jgi:hypothetical protein
MFLTDDGGHFVRKVTLGGEVFVGARRAGQAGAAHERRAVPALKAEA